MGTYWLDIDSVHGHERDNYMEMREWSRENTCGAQFAYILPICAFSVYLFAKENCLWSNFQVFYVRLDEPNMHIPYSLFELLMEELNALPTVQCTLI